LELQNLLFTQNLNFIGTAFLPVVISFLIFLYVISKYAEEESEQEKMVREWYASKFTKKRKSRKIAPITKVTQYT